MKRKQLVERIAAERAVALHTAADWLDAFLHDLLQHLKRTSAPAARAAASKPAKGQPAKAHEEGR